MSCEREREIGFYYGGSCGLVTGTIPPCGGRQMVDSKSTFIDFAIRGLLLEFFSYVTLWVALSLSLWGDWVLLWRSMWSRH